MGGYLRQLVGLSSVAVVGTTTPVRHEMRNNTVRRRSHENLFHCRTASAVWAVLIVPLFATIAAPPVAAQNPITAPPGQTVMVPAGDTITCTDCVALLTQGPPGGTIIAPGPFTLNVTSNGGFTAGANVLFGTGGTIQLNNGTIINIDNLLQFGPGATAVFAQSGLITGTNVNITGSGFQSTALQAETGGQIIWSGGAITMTNNTNSGVIVARTGGAVDDRYDL